MLCDVWLGHRISIHAPRVGATLLHSADSFHIWISIHAPCVGSDLHELDTLHHASIFQSTLPVWGATTPPFSHSSYAVFQSTLPAWGATFEKVTKCQSVHKFQSTLPMWGATLSDVAGTSARGNFNPRSPCGERQQRCTDFSFASSAKRVFFCDILQIGRHLQGIGRKRWGDFLSRSVRTSRGKYGYLAFAFRESGGLRENRRFYSQSVLFSFRIDCQGSRILGCPFRGP